MKKICLGTKHENDFDISWGTTEERLSLKTLMSMFLYHLLWQIKNGQSQLFNCQQKLKSQSNKINHPEPQYLFWIYLGLKENNNQIKSNAAQLNAFYTTDHFLNDNMENLA